MIKAIIFDMDGLMVDTEPLYSQAMQEIAQRRNKCFTLELKQKMMGRLGIESMRIFKDALGLNESPEEILKEREKIYEKLITQDVKPMPGLFNLLELLNKMGLRKAIASSSKRRWVELIITKLGITNEFEVIVSGEEVEHGKPHPDIYLLVAKKLNITPNECLVVEDSLSGVEAAKAANMTCIVIPNQFTQGLNFSYADILLNSLEEINEDLLKRL